MTPPKIQGTPRDPAREIAELKDLIRQAHEAAQELRGLLRESDAEYKAWVKFMEQFRDGISSLLGELTEKAVKNELAAWANARETVLIREHHYFKQVTETWLHQVQAALGQAGMSLAVGRRPAFTRQQVVTEVDQAELVARFMARLNSDQWLQAALRERTGGTGDGGAERASGEGADAGAGAPEQG